MVNLFAEFFAPVGEVASHAVTFEILPNPLDGVKIGTVGRKINRFDMVPDKSFGLMPARVIQDQTNADALSPLRLCFLGHCIQEGLENLGVAVRHNQTHQLTASGIDGSGYVLTDMATIVSLGWS